MSSMGDMGEGRPLRYVNSRYNVALSTDGPSYLKEVRDLVSFLLALEEPFMILLEETIAYISPALMELLVEMGFSSSPEGKGFGEYFGGSPLKVKGNVSPELEGFKLASSFIKLPISNEDKELEWLMLPLRDDMGEQPAMLLILKNDAELGIDFFRQNIVNNLSHELRTPLTILKGMLDYLLNPVAASISRDELVEHLKLMMQKTLDLEGLIHELLEIVRLERGTLKFNKYWFPIYPLMDRIASRYMGRAKKFKVKVEKRLDIPKDLEIYADAARMNYLLNELLENAVKFSLEGGSVEFNAYIDDNSELVIEVKDNGIGIPDAHIDKVFNPFFKGDNRPNRRVYGVGLGLFIVRRIVEGHDGVIELMSSEGKGTTVKVKLPQIRLAGSEGEVKLLQSSH